MIIGLLLKAPSLDCFLDSVLVGLLAALLGHLAPHSPTAQDLRNICSFLLLVKRRLSLYALEDHPRNMPRVLPLQQDLKSRPLKPGDSGTSTANGTEGHSF